MRKTSARWSFLYVRSSSSELKVGSTVRLGPDWQCWKGDVWLLAGTTGKTSSLSREEEEQSERLMRVGMGRWAGRQATRADRSRAKGVRGEDILEVETGRTVQSKEKERVRVPDKPSTSSRVDWEGNRGCR